MKLTNPIPDAVHERLVERYMDSRASSGPLRALRNLRRDLDTLPFQVSVACALAIARSGDVTAASALFDWLISRVQDSTEARFDLGNILFESGELSRAESLFRPLMQLGHIPATEAIAAILQTRGSLSAAAETISNLAKREIPNVSTAHARATFAEQCQRTRIAYEICDESLRKFPDDPSLGMLAGRMAAGLGNFDLAREHYLRALKFADIENTSALLHALSAVQRYADADHEDFKQFRAFLKTNAVSPAAHASVQFALGKASDDIGEYAAAAAAFRIGNRLIRNSLTWSPKLWREYVDQRIAAVAIAKNHRHASFAPIFVVGLPRSGTTLIADRLGRHPQIRNRDELNLIPFIDKRLQQVPKTEQQHWLENMISFAEAHLRQDDVPARFYVDKNPLNFRFVPLIAHLFPDARIIYCKRGLRDTALSIWQQYFARGEDNGYAYTFRDILAFAQGCERLMKRWQQQQILPIFELRYERFVTSPELTLARLKEFLGLSDADALAGESIEQAMISTSSAWQARQTIYLRSVNRWLAYADHLPELLESIPDDDASA